MRIVQGMEKSRPSIVFHRGEHNLAISLELIRRMPQCPPILSHRRKHNVAIVLEFVGYYTESLVSMSYSLQNARAMMRERRARLRVRFDTVLIVFL